ncbi:DUF1772 domain-containing protein [Streptomyces sp. NPDC058653]|uniref:anthrone oxygenase family protein n=1 Tax=Streptomyces sp. NPDC058653 TaxID=3346576 RepID=UPI003668CEF1
MTDHTPRQRRARRDSLRSVMLILAIVTTGLLAGVFASWSNAIMPGLREVDDRTFVASFRALDEAITNPLFLGGFTLALPLIALSAVLHRRPEHRAVLVWVGVALVCYLIAVVITFGVHEPLNGEFRTAAEPGAGVGSAAARARLDEAKWTAWNTARAWASTIAFGCLARALVIRGRLDASPARTGPPASA